jgi:hypothetical protein
LGLSTNSSEKVRVTSGGDVGIGVTIPTQKLDVLGAVAHQGLFFTTTNKHYIYDSGVDTISFRINNGSTATSYLDFTVLSSTPGLNAPGGTLMFSTSEVERMRIDSSGNVGIGGTPSYKLDVRGTAAGSTIVGAVRNLSTANNSAAALSLATGVANSYTSLGVNNASGTPYLQLVVGSALSQMFMDVGTTQFRSPSGAQTNAVISNTGGHEFRSPSNALLQVIGSSGYGGILVNGSGVNNSYVFFQSGATEAGRITVDASGNIQFANGASATERVRINAAGDLLVGTTTTDPIGARVNGVRIAVPGSSWGVRGSTLGLGTSGGTGTHLAFYTDNGSAAVAAGSISSSGTTTTYNTSSDRRLKTDIITLPGALSRVMSLPARAFRWRSEALGPRVDGFIADEAMKVVPQAVLGEPNAVDGDGKPVYQQIDHSKLVPVLWAAVQELTARVQQLEHPQRAQ